MASLGQVVTLATTATLLFQCLDGESYAALASPAANQFKAGDGNKPLAIMLVFPASPNIYLGGSTVTNSGGTIGALVPASFVLNYNAIGGDSLYAVAASATPAVQLLVLGGF